MAILAQKCRVFLGFSSQSGSYQWFAMGIRGHQQKSAKNVTFLKKSMLNLARPIPLKGPPKDCLEY
jgi:hypothetical protein